MVEWVRLREKFFVNLRKLIDYGKTVSGQQYLADDDLDQYDDHRIDFVG